jgi:hypothetical protein
MRVRRQCVGTTSIDEKRSDPRRKTTSDSTPSPFTNVITIRRSIGSHLDRIMRGSVEETLNALPDAEADGLRNAQRKSAARTVAISEPALAQAADQGRRGPAQGPQPAIIEHYLLPTLLFGRRVATMVSLRSTLMSLYAGTSIFRSIFLICG